MSINVVSALAFVEARLYSLKLWSLATQAQKLKQHLSQAPR